MPSDTDPETIVRKLGPDARLIRHPALDQPIRTAMEFAQALGYPPEQVAKTLLLRGGGDTVPAYAAAVLSLPDRADLNVMAGLMRTSEVTLATAEDLRQVLGTVPGAVSLFQVRDIPLYVDETLLALPTVYVGSGRPGIDIAISPDRLVAFTGARVGQLSRHR